jgi:hypothetical protein
MVFCTVADASASAESRPKVEVWKDPTCGCCKDWVAHLEKSGFDLTSSPAWRRDDSCYQRAKSGPSRLRDLIHCGFIGFRLPRSGEFLLQRHQATGQDILGRIGIPVML